MPAARFLLGDTWDAGKTDGADKALDDIFGGAHGHDDDIICLDERISSASREDVLEIH
jgi:hypothetical protein